MTESDSNLPVLYGENTIPFKAVDERAIKIIIFLFLHEKKYIVGMYP